MPLTRSVRPGTVAKVNTGDLPVPRGSPAFILSVGRGGVVKLLTDAGIATVARREIAIPNTPLPRFAPMRLRLAYGMWTERDGSTVLVSRDYFPLWRKNTDGRVAPADPWEWIDVIDEAYFWGAKPPWQNWEKEREIERRMNEWGAAGLPRLMGVIGILVRQQAETVRDAVRLLVPAGVQPHGHL